MKPIKGYKDVQASGDFERLPAGGYIIKITAVQDEPSKEYLRIIYDIAEGPEAGRYKNEAPENDYRHAFVRSYKEKALGMFKAFTLAVDASNGSKITEQVEKGLQEQQLVGKALGVVFGYEEYNANDGNVKERLRLAAVTTPEKIRAGEYKVPELKKLNPSTVTIIPDGFTPLSDDSLPF